MPFADTSTTGVAAAESFWRYPTTTKKNRNSNKDSNYYDGVIARTK